MTVRAEIPRWALPILAPATRKSARGGRGSSKTHSFSQLAVLRMASLLGAYGYPDGPVRIASFRQFKISIEESVKQTIQRYIGAYGLADEFDVQKYSIDHANGSHIFFPGFDRNTSSFMGAEDVDVLWVEQAETLEGQMGVIAPTLRKPGCEQWYTWNTAGRDQFCFQEFVLHPEPDDVSLLVNWQDNPWWYPRCEQCGTFYEFQEAPDVCDCGNVNVWPGLWELERLRRRCQELEPEIYPNRYMGEPADTDVESKVLPYQMVEACRQAFIKGLAPAQGGHATIAGLDLAEGGADKCALVIVTGPLIKYIDVWPGVTGDLHQAAVRAHEACVQHGVARLYYDASSPIRSEFIRLGASYQVRPCNFGGAVGGPDVIYERGRPARMNKDVFARLNIQMATAVRLRMQRTMQLLRGEDVDPYRCCFIDPQAIAPGCRVTNMESYLSSLTGPIRRIPPGSGKWELDKRGGDEAAESPDDFDGTCLAFRADCDRLRAM